MEITGRVTPLRVGIVGAGHMGAIHAQHWANVPGVSVVGFADGRGTKAEALASRYHGAHVYVAVEEMLEAHIDVVSVCVPTDGHRSVAVTTLSAGVDTFCEKPLSLTIADCDAMIAARDNHGARLTVGQVARFFPDFANAKRLIDAGAVGTPASARVRRGGDFPRTDTDWFANPLRSGGVIFDLMIHDLDWLLWCFGPVIRVYARSVAESVTGKHVDHLDYALLTLRHANGVVSHVEGTWADPGGFATTFEIAGDGGLLTHDSRRAAPLTKALRTVEGGVRAGVAMPSSPLAESDDPFYRELAAFAHSIRENTPVAVSAEEARRAVALALAAQESARTGRAVGIEEEGRHG